MNQEVVFFIGIIIFAITIYGSVMAGGMALSKVMIDQEPPQQPEAKDGTQDPSISLDKP